MVQYYIIDYNKRKAVIMTLENIVYKKLSKT